MHEHVPEYFYLTQVVKAANLDGAGKILLQGLTCTGNLFLVLKNTVFQWIGNRRTFDDRITKDSVSYSAKL
jgi:hypothetical protein